MEYAICIPSAWQYLQQTGAHHHYWLSLAMAAFPAANAVSSPIYGLVADHYSAKRVLVFSNIFEMIGNVLYMVAPSPTVIVIGRFLAGMGAGVGAVAFAYCARVTTSVSSAGRI